MNLDLIPEKDVEVRAIGRALNLLGNLVYDPVDGVFLGLDQNDNPVVIDPEKDFTVQLAQIMWVVFEKEISKMPFHKQMQLTESFFGIAPKVLEGHYKRVQH